MSRILNLKFFDEFDKYIEFDLSEWGVLVSYIMTNIGNIIP